MSELPDRNTVQQVAEFWGCSVETVKRRIKSGALGCVRTGRILRITREQVLEFENAHTTKQAIVLRQPAQPYLRGRTDAYELGRIIAGRLLAEAQSLPPKPKVRKR